MINFRRAMPPPKKLQERSFEGVKNCLIEMQANKCYMCERKAPDSSQIEHFIPVSKGSEELKFSWENLFWHVAIVIRSKIMFLTGKTLHSLS